MSSGNLVRHLSKGVLAATLLNGCVLDENGGLPKENIGTVEIIDKYPKKRNVCRDMPEDIEYDAAVDTYFEKWYGSPLLKNSWTYLPEGWDVWMKKNEGEGLSNTHDRFCRTFYLSRDLDRTLTMSVDIYQDPAKVYQDSSWAGSGEQIDLLEEFLELTYPGWNFTLTSVIGLPEESKNKIKDENHVQLYLGYEGTSHAGGNKIYVHYDPIVGHELAHILGLGHHYPSENHVGDNWFAAPGEVKCLMDRTWNQFGSPERFALGTTLDVDNEEKIKEIVTHLNSKYVENY